MATGPRDGRRGLFKGFNRAAAGAGRALASFSAGGRCAYGMRDPRARPDPAKNFLRASWNAGESSVRKRGRRGRPLTPRPSRRPPSASDLRPRPRPPSAPPPAWLHPTSTRSALRTRALKGAGLGRVAEMDGRRAAGAEPSRLPGPPAPEAGGPSCARRHLPSHPRPSALRLDRAPGRGPAL